MPADENPRLPFAITLEATTAALTLDEAAEVFDRLAALLPEGVFLEGGGVELMKPSDVLNGSPLHKALH